jgi:hypothetical protein
MCRRYALDKISIIITFSDLDLAYYIKIFQSQKVMENIATLMLSSADYVMGWIICAK